jgi:hypothetical protein
MIIDRLESAMILRLIGANPGAVSKGIESSAGSGESMSEVFQVVTLPEEKKKKHGTT